MSAHHFLAHAPLPLLLLGAAADLAGALLGRVDYRRWAGGLLILGALAALAAFLTGQGAVAAAFARPQPEYARIEVHSQWGGAAVWVLVAAGALRTAWRGRLQGAHGHILLGAALVSAVLVVQVARSGLAIAHGG